LAGAAIAERRRAAKVVAIKWLAKGGMPDPLLAGFPDGTGEAEESGTIVGGEGGAELKVIKGGYSKYFNQDTEDGSGRDTAL
jgi:hypothetical protein